MKERGYTPVCVLCLVERQGDGEHDLAVRSVASDGTFRVFLPVCPRHETTTVRVITPKANEAKWIGPVSKPEPKEKAKVRT